MFSLLISTLAIGQGLSSSQRFGYIIDNDGNQVNGVIHIKHIGLPWDQQDKIFFYATEEVDETMKYKKKDMEKYITGDIQGFSYEDRMFTSIEYVNLAGASKGASLSGGLNKLSAAATSLGNSSFFAEELIKGKTVTLYKFYNKPPDFAVLSDEQSEVYDDISDAAKYDYDLLFAKPGDKAKNVETIRYKKYFGDCKKWVKKFENGDFDLEEKKNKKGKKALIQSHSREEIMGRYQMMIDEYDTLCN